MGRVTINGTVAQFSCKRSIAKELWDAKGNRAKGKSLEARETNLALDSIKAQIIKHYQRISDREAFVTAEMVRNAYQGIGGEYETLLKAFDRENEVFKKRVGKDRKLATYQSRVVYMEKFCLKVGFNERQTATLINGKPLFYEGELYSEEHRRKFTTEEAGFQVVKDPKDKSKLALAINGQVIGEWFKEQFGRLFSSVKRTVEPLRRGKGMGL